MFAEEIRSVFYTRERYAVQLRVKRSRLGAWQSGAYSLKDHERITQVMTKWLHRCVRHQPVVMGAATVTLYEWWQERPVLLAVANAYRDVRPEHRDALVTLVDGPMYSVQLPEGG